VPVLATQVKAQLGLNNGAAAADGAAPGAGTSAAAGASNGTNGSADGSGAAAKAGDSGKHHPLLLNMLAEQLGVQVGVSGLNPCI
jgi:hypothetical protein